MTIATSKTFSPSLQDLLEPSRCQQAGRPRCKEASTRRPRKSEISQVTCSPVECRRKPRKWRGEAWHTRRRKCLREPQKPLPAPLALLSARLQWTSHHPPGKPARDTQESLIPCATADTLPVQIQATQIQFGSGETVAMRTYMGRSRLTSMGRSVSRSMSVTSTAGTATSIGRRVKV